MKFKKEWLEKRWVANAAALSVGAAVYVALSHFSTFLNIIQIILSNSWPIFIGIMITYVVNPLVDLLELKLFGKVRKEKLRHNISVVVAIVLVFVVVAVILIALIPQIVGSVMHFIRNLDFYVQNIRNLLADLNAFAMERNIDISGVTTVSEDLVDQIAAAARSNINTILNTSYNIGRGVFNGIIGFILAVYFMIGKKQIGGGFERTFRLMLSEKRFAESSKFWIRCNNILTRYVVGDLLDGMIVGVVNFIFMVITDMPYGVLVSVVVGVTNLAPTFGPIIGAVIGAFILVWQNPWNAFWFLIFTMILQTFDGYILKPKLFGNTLGVSPAWILIAIILGGRIFGMIGVLLAIPLTAILDYLYDSWVIMMERKRKEEKEKKEEN